MSALPSKPYDNLTKQAFDAVGWPTLIAAAQTKDCCEYIRPLIERAKALEEANTHDAAHAARALADIMGYGFHPYEVDRPFQPAMLWGNQRSPLPEDLPDSVLPVLLQLFNEATDPEFKARLGDVCSLRLSKKDRPLVEATAAAYIASAQNLFQTNKWDHGVPRFRRALQLARKPSPPLAKQLADAFADFLKNHAPRSPLLEVVQMLELNRERVGDDAASLSAEAAAYAQKAQDQKAWHLRRRLLSLAADCLLALMRLVFCLICNIIERLASRQNACST